MVCMTTGLVLKQFFGRRFSEPGLCQTCQTNVKWVISTWSKECCSMCPSTQSCAVLIIFIQPFPSHPGGGTGFPLRWLVLSPDKAHQVSS